MSPDVVAAADGPAARRALESRIAAGGVVLFPSDGLYGLACDPMRREAIDRIHAIKGRDEGKPSAVMYFSPLAMRELLTSLDEPTRDALGALLPGPVTLVVANRERRYPLICGETPERLGVRLIEGPLSGAMCPVMQTSANPAGAPPPARFEDIDPQLLEAVDLAIDGGGLAGEPSTVVDVAEISRDRSWRLLREGAMSPADVRSKLDGSGAVWTSVPTD